MTRRLGLVASALLVGIGILYWGLLIGQAGPGGLASEIGPNVILFGVALVVLAVLTAYGAMASSAQRRAIALWVAIPGVAVMGYIAIFSIGLFILLAGLAALAAAIAALRPSDVHLGPVLASVLAASVGWVAIALLIFWLAQGSASA